MGTLILALCVAALAAVTMSGAVHQRQVNAGFAARLTQLEASCPEPVGLQRRADEYAQSVGQVVRSVLGREVL